MFTRFAVVIYIFSHLLILSAVSYEIADSYVWNYIGVDYYNVRCEGSNKLVVLQGNSEPFELGGHLYKTRYINQISKQWVEQEEETMRFYCHYFNEVEKHVLAYQNIRTNEERIKANTEFWNFRDANEAPFRTNYTLELVRTESDWSGLLGAIAYWIFYTLFLYAILQLIRLIYQYIVYGKFKWHPYKKVEIGSEEEYVKNFLVGMKGTGLKTQEVKDIYLLVKSRMDNRDYIGAKELADKFSREAQAILSNERRAKDAEWAQPILDEKK